MTLSFPIERAGTSLLRCFRRTTRTSWIRRRTAISSRQRARALIFKPGLSSGKVLPSREELLAVDAARGGLKIKEKDIQHMSEIKNGCPRSHEILHSEYAFPFNHSKNTGPVYGKKTNDLCTMPIWSCLAEQKPVLGKSLHSYGFIEYEIEDITHYRKVSATVCL